MKGLGAALTAAGVALIAAGKAAGATQSKPGPRIPFDDIFTRMAGKYGVPKRLMAAIVAHESAFDPRAENEETKADAKRGRDVDSLGLGQILWPDTAKDYGITNREDLFNPETNLDAVARILRDKLKRYPPVAPMAFPEDAVSAYNGGHSLRKQSGSFANQEYVNRVRIKWEGYADV